jgi:23S rRNA (cytidine1920-2'-O)/16S rRNA (cytidine1409-2'-O)-methyltransferase
MACLRLLTLLPLRPLLSVPFLRFFMARSTYLEAPFEYLRAILILLKQTIIAPLQMLSANAGNDRVWAIVPGVDCMSGTRERADRLLVARGIFESRAKAQAAIEAGLVTANDQIVRKASEEIPTDASLRATSAHPYVSRGGVKLAAALDHFDFNPKGRICLDVGASTGGFTQVLLKRGAQLVYAVDVGRAQLHETLRARPEIVSLEATDIRSLSAARFDDRPDFVTIDVSFISLKLVVPPVTKLIKAPALLVALIKPQFEVGASAVKKGIVRDPALHAGVCKDIAEFVTSLGWRVISVIPSPIEGGDGNAEFLLGADHD